MEEYIFLDEYQKRIVEIINQEDILSLDNFIFNNLENCLELLSKIEKTRGFVNENGTFDFITNDLIFSLSPAIQFSIANLYLYQPYTNDFPSEIIASGEKDIPTYSVKVGEKRYLYFLNISFEKLYNYWDRIGDLLNICFDLGFSNDKVYFSNVIDRLSQLNIESEALYWFKTFKENDYSDYINRIRKTIVHHRQKETYFLVEFLGSLGNDDCRENMEKLQLEKNSYPNILKEELYLANQGFEKMVELIKDFGKYEIS